MINYEKEISTRVNNALAGFKHSDPVTCKVLYITINQLYVDGLIIEPYEAEKPLILPGTIKPVVIKCSFSTCS